jgi:hypothetical protein
MASRVLTDVVFNVASLAYKKIPLLSQPLSIRCRQMRSRRSRWPRNFAAKPCHSICVGSCAARMLGLKDRGSLAAGRLGDAAFAATT